MKHLLIAYFVSNICDKDYQNRLMHVEVIARQISDIFEVWESERLQIDIVIFKVTQVEPCADEFFRWF